MTIIKDYEVFDLLGTGPLGDAYRARDTRDGRPVVLILVADAIAGVPARRQQLLEDATKAASLVHPHIAALWEVGEQEELVFLAAEHVTGTTLRALIRSRRVNAARAVEIAIQIAEALDAARSVGLVHQNLNPTRIILTSSGVRILDLGLSAWTAYDDPESRAYLSPEQVIGERLDHRSDVFSLGTILYEMLTGRAPFNGASPDETALRIAQASPPPPSSLNSAVPAALDAIVARALAKSLDARYETSSAMASQLRAIAPEVTGETEGAAPTGAGMPRSRLLFLAAAVLLALAVVGIPTWLGHGERKPGPATSTTASKRGDPVAERLYAQGREAADRRDRSRAIALYEQAIAREPGLAKAHAGLAEALYLEEFYLGGRADASAGTRARSAAERAVASDPALPQAQLVMGLTAQTLSEALSRLRRAVELDRSFSEAYHQMGDQIAGIDPARAVELYRRSLGLNPGLDANHRDLASTFELLGRPEEAAREITAGRGARPDRPWWNQMQARLEMGRRQYGAAAAILEADPAAESTPTVWLMGHVVSLQLAGRTRDALQTAARGSEKYPWFCEGRAVLNGLRWQTGEREEARAALAGIMRDAGKPGAPAAAIVCAATAAASAQDAAQTAFWLRRIAHDEPVLRLWIRQAVFSPYVAYRRAWYPWNEVAAQPEVREAWSEIEGGIDHLRPVVARLLNGLPSASAQPPRSQ
jgi:tetratricopeptide (TPR) repeat protein